MGGCHPPSLCGLSPGRGAFPYEPASSWSAPLVAWLPPRIGICSWVLLHWRRCGGAVPCLLWLGVCMASWWPSTFRAQSHVILLSCRMLLFAFFNLIFGLLFHDLVMIFDFAPCLFVCLRDVVAVCCNCPTLYSSLLSLPLPPFKSLETLLCSKRTPHPDYRRSLLDSSTAENICLKRQLASVGPQSFQFNLWFKNLNMAALFNLLKLATVIIRENAFV